MESATSEGLKAFIYDESTVSLQVLDQTVLPHIKQYSNIENLRDTFEAIVSMKVRGAPMISTVALHGLIVDLLKNQKDLHDDQSKLKDYLKKSSEYLISSRPTAVNLYNDLHLLVSQAEVLNEASDILKLVSRFARENISDYAASTKKMSEIGAEFVIGDFTAKHNTERPINVLTICNTGKLAIPGIGTALGVVRELKKRGKLNTLYIPETRPYNQGSRLTAFEAIEDELNGILISDSMTGMLMKTGKVDCVIVGADRVTKSGATANKIGTYTLSVLAKQHNIPFYVILPESTIDHSLKSGKEIVIEFRPENELKSIQGVKIAPDQIKAWNPAFDVTPPQLISRIITEKGEYSFSKENDEFEILNPTKIQEILVSQKLINSDDTIAITDIADGNLNLVYKIQVNRINEEKPYITYCMKQALPYIKCIGEDYPLSLDRSIFEAEGLKYEDKICPGIVPKFFYSNDKLFIIIMEFLEDHIILKKGFIEGIKYSNLSLIGEFAAKTCFYSSTIHLSPAEYRKNVEFWNKNNGLCEITEKYFLSDPFIKAEGNSFLPGLNEIVEKIQTTPSLLSKVISLRNKFVEQKQALIHGDMHSGSFMVNYEKKSVKVIDSEFSFYGPISFDVGSIFGSYFISIFSQPGYRSKETLEDYQNYLKTQISEFWFTFKAEFTKLWNEEKNRFSSYPGIHERNPELLKYQQEALFEEILGDSFGFAGIELIRRIVGVAKTRDFELISDKEVKVACELKALNFAVALIESHKSLNSIEAIFQLL